MCFVLYAGTTHPLPRSEWQKDAPAVCVAALSEPELPVKAYFSAPEVQYIGSTSQCGCDFPHDSIQNQHLWPNLDAGEYPERDADASQNCNALVELLRSSGENTVELYGLWDGNYMEPPKTRETIPLDKLLDPHFYFKEDGFYTVKVRA